MKQIINIYVENYLPNENKKQIKARKKGSAQIENAPDQLRIIN